MKESIPLYDVDINKLPIMLHAKRYSKMYDPNAYIRTSGNTWLMTIVFIIGIGLLITAVFIL